MSTELQVTMRFTATVEHGLIDMDYDEHSLADVIKFHVGLSDLNDMEVDVSAFTITEVKEALLEPLQREYILWSKKHQQMLEENYKALKDEMEKPLLFSNHSPKPVQETESEEVEHQCSRLELPPDHLTYRRTGTQWQCSECGKKWLYLPIIEAQGKIPLRWWHRWTRSMKD